MSLVRRHRRASLRLPLRAPAPPPLARDSGGPHGGGLRVRCPECHRAMPSGMWLFTVYTAHYAMAHLRIPVFRRPGCG